MECFKVDTIFGICCAQRACVLVKGYLFGILCLSLPSQRPTARSR